jgi:hypothetical protein
MNIHPRQLRPVGADLITRTTARAHLVPAGYVHGATPTGIDAGIYGFIANILFYDIDTPLKQFVVAHGNLVRHCRAIHADVAPAEGSKPA